MTKKNKSDPENLNDDEGAGLDELLSDFANIMGDNNESSKNQQIDHNGMALSEILGEDVSQNTREKQQLEPEIVDENEDYASFLKDFEELGSKDTSESAPVGESGDSEAYAVEEKPQEIGDEAPDLEGDVSESSMVIVESEAGLNADYSSILEELGKDKESPETGELVDEDVLTLDDEESGKLSFGGLDTADESVSYQDETAMEAVADIMEEPEGESDSMKLNFGLEDTDVEAPDADKEPAIIIPTAETEDERDFLGLSNSGVEKQDKADFLDVDSGALSDVLFDGVEMDFDEQATMVTRAELLLAQKKKDEAANLYKEVAEKKGTTFWVEKRLRQLS